MSENRKSNISKESLENIWFEAELGSTPEEIAEELDIDIEDVYATLGINIEDNSSSSKIQESCSNDQMEIINQLKQQIQLLQITLENTQSEIIQIKQQNQTLLEKGVRTSMAETMKTQQAIQQWEYQLLELLGAYPREYEEKLSHLNRLGSQGWEVISTITSCGSTMRLLLKRPIVQ